MRNDAVNVILSRSNETDILFFRPAAPTLQTYFQTGRPRDEKLSHGPYPSGVKKQKRVFITQNARRSDSIALLCFAVRTTFSRRTRAPTRIRRGHRVGFHRGNCSLHQEPAKHATWTKCQKKKTVFTTVSIVFYYNHRHTRTCRRCRLLSDLCGLLYRCFKLCNSELCYNAKKTTRSRRGHRNCRYIVCRTK